jgi:hypothetical protein
MTEGWGVVAGAEVLASAGMVVSVTVAATAAAQASTARDILIFTKVRCPSWESQSRERPRMILVWGTEDRMCDD